MPNRNLDRRLAALESSGADQLTTIRIIGGPPHEQDEAHIIGGPLLIRDPAEPLAAFLARAYALARSARSRCVVISGPEIGRAGPLP